MRYLDPDGKALNFVVGAFAGGVAGGLVSGGLGTIKVINDAKNVYKAASIAIDVASGAVAGATNTVVSNSMDSSKNLTDDLGFNIGLGAAGGLLTGATTKTGIKVSEFGKNSSKIYYETSKGLSTSNPAKYIEKGIAIETSLLTEEISKIKTEIIED